MDVLEQLEREFIKIFPNDVIPSQIEDCLDDNNQIAQQISKLSSDLENLKHKVKQKEFLLSFLKSHLAKQNEEKNNKKLSRSMLEAIQRFTDPDDEFSTNIEDDENESNGEENPVVEISSESDETEIVNYPRRYSSIQLKRKKTEEDDEENDSELYVNVQLQRNNDCSPSYRFCKTSFNSVDETDTDKSENTKLEACRQMLSERKKYMHGIIDDDMKYVKTLETLMQVKHKFDIAATNRKLARYIKKEETDKIFLKIPDMLESHKTFVEKLKTKLDSWEDETQIGDVFEKLIAEDIDNGGIFLQNQVVALALAQKLLDTMDKKRELKEILNPCIKTEMMKNESLKNFESSRALFLDFLQKPITRVQKSLSLIPVIIKLTPLNHEDYEILNKINDAGKNFLLKCQPNSNNEEKGRHEIRNCVISEKNNNSNRLRTLVLFNDCLACCRLIRSDKDNIQLMLKWFLPIQEIDDMKIENGSQRRKAELKVLRDKLNATGSEMNKLRTFIASVSKISNAFQNIDTEFKEQRMVDNKFEIDKNTNQFNKLAAKARELMEKLTSLSPFLPLVIKSKSKKIFTVLFTSELERTKWVDEIKDLQIKLEKLTKSFNSSLSKSVASRIFNKLSSYDNNKISSTDVQNSLNLIPLHCLTDPLDHINEDLSNTKISKTFLVYGSVHIIIHNVNGLVVPSSVKCVVEIDSYGQRYICNSTSIVVDEMKPSWEDQGFWVDFEGSEIMKMYVLRIVDDDSVKMGECTLLLSELISEAQGKTNKTVTKNLSINEKEMSIDLSIMYESRKETIQRQKNVDNSTVFGVDLIEVCNREKEYVPIIVKSCIQNVEMRGINEEGIYRLSGLSKDVTKLKFAFDKDSIKAERLCNDYDINVVCSVVKLYFRELPEPLFLDLYSDAMVNISKDTMRSKIVQFLNNMNAKASTRYNYETIKFLMKHLIKIADNSSINKMVINNLATVFGPTLLQQSSSEISDKIISSSQLNDITQQALTQANILLQVLEMTKEGLLF